jgi:hypothetical protein
VKNELVAGRIGAKKNADGTVSCVCINIACSTAR